MMIFEEFGLGLGLRSRVRVKFKSAPGATFLGVNFQGVPDAL